MIKWVCERMIKHTNMSITETQTKTNDSYHLLKEMQRLKILKRP